MRLRSGDRGSGRQEPRNARGATREALRAEARGKGVLVWCGLRATRRGPSGRQPWKYVICYNAAWDRRWEYAVCCYLVWAVSLRQK